MGHGAATRRCRTIYAEEATCTRQWLSALRATASPRRFRTTTTSAARTRILRVTIPTRQRALSGLRATETSGYLVLVTTVTRGRAGKQKRPGSRYKALAEQNSISDYFFHINFVPDLARPSFSSRNFRTGGEGSNYAHAGIARAGGGSSLIYRLVPNHTYTS